MLVSEAQGAQHPRHRDDVGGVGFTHSTNETSNDGEGKGWTYEPLLNTKHLQHWRRDELDSLIIFEGIHPNTFNSLLVGSEDTGTVPLSS